jgi:hypothetical protein
MPPLDRRDHHARSIVIAARCRLDAAAAMARHGSLPLPVAASVLPPPRTPHPFVVEARISAFSPRASAKNSRKFFLPQSHGMRLRTSLLSGAASETSLRLIRVAYFPLPDRIRRVTEPPDVGD